MIPRAPIANALLALVTAGGVFATTGRKFVPWDRVPPSEQPALFVLMGDETIERVGGGPVGGRKRQRPFDLIVYARSEDDAVSGMQVLEPLLDLVETRLEPGTGQQAQTLGGLVVSVNLESIETDAGFLGQQAVASMKGTIVVAG